MGMNMRLHTPNAACISIPVVFFDRYMPKASGEFVKVYLSFYRRCMSEDQELSITDLADSLHLMERDVLRALRYWEDMGLLSVVRDSNEEVQEVFFQFPEDKAPEKQSLAEKIALSQKTLSTKEPKPNMQALSRDSSFAQILFLAERLLKKTLSPSDTEKFAYWYRLFPGKPEILEFLIEYCAEQGHTKLPYLEKVILSWHSAGLTTLSDIQDYIKNRNQKVYTVMKEFGLQGRMPGTKEGNYIDKWYNEYGFSVEMVSLACQKTLSAIREPSFEYADRILSYWKAQNAMTKSSVQNLDAAHREKAAQKAQTASQNRPLPKKTRFHNFEERNVNYEQLEDALSFDY